MEEKKFSLIMPVYKTERYLRRAIKSIKDQDYKNWELICVLDGRQPGCEGIIKTFEKKCKKIRHITIKHGGACKARNEGAKLATGDYYSFFSSDFEARPGMLSMWSRYFKENTDCDFVYGGYCLLDKGKMVFTYPSQEFSKYLLTCYNYIDGGFPVRKEAYLPWDENCKSLNDWEWILRIVKNGSKGKYIKEISYNAEVPRKDGLSFDSTNNWIKRVDYIKKKHRIPKRKVCIMSQGAPTHGIRTAELLGYDYKPDPFYKPNEYDAIYFMGFFLTENMSYFVEKSRDMKKIIHWIGSDVLQILQMSVTDLENLKQLAQFDKCVHLCQSERLKRELKRAGINATVLSIPLDTDNYEVMDMPEQPCVAVYAPYGNALYNEHLMNVIATNMPDIKFKFFGDDYRTGKVMNVEYCGMVTDMKEFIKDCSCVLRYTRHDGFPVSPTEFMLMGRNAITNVDMPHAKIIKYENEATVMGIIKKIVEVLREDIHSKPNTKAAKFYQRYLSPQKFKKRLERMI
jgi:glycosyltransferase involved in cell wall biosynthesis